MAGTLGLLVTAAVLAAAPTADVIYTGGPVVTLDDAHPAAEAVAVRDGHIAAVGGRAEVTALRGDATRVVDLGGKTLVPGFVDAHSHFSQAIATADWLNLSAPPVGNVTSIAALKNAVKSSLERSAPKAGQWIIGYGYDPSMLSDGRELDRDDLDQACADHPVLVVLVSMHGAVLNSKALAAVGIDANTPTPAGGVIRRKPGSREPAGLLMESAILPVYGHLPRPDAAGWLAGLKTAQERYAARGYTTAVDAPVERGIAALYRQAADQGRLVLDVIAYASWLDLPKLVAVQTDFRGPSRNHLKWPAGVKIIGDGSPQGKTAFFTQPYLTDGPEGQKNWRGEPNLSQAELDRLIKMAYNNHAQVEIHANGDAAIDMLLSAHRAAGAPTGRRTTVIHSQFVRPDQLDRYVEYGFVPSFFTNHTFFWGDLHVRNLGTERAFFLSPMKSARKRGLHMTNHTDAPVTPADPLFTVWTAVNRTSRSGQVIGPDERATPIDALRAITLDAAYQYFEETTKGSIEPGKLADLVILSANPLEADAATLKDIQVVETIKEGRTIYRR